MWAWIKSLFGPTTVRETYCMNGCGWQTFTESHYSDRQYSFIKCDKCGSEGNGEVRDRPL